MLSSRCVRFWVVVSSERVVVFGEVAELSAHQVQGLERIRFVPNFVGCRVLGAWRASVASSGEENVAWPNQKLNGTLHPLSRRLQEQASRQRARAR